MGGCAFLFPGQGGQFVGQGREFMDRGPEMEDLFSLAEDIAGLDLKSIVLNGPAAELNRTENLQPAILTVSLAIAKIMVREGLNPSLACGHSLGEYGALCLAGVFSEKEALTLVTARAKIMQRAADQKPGAMAAVLNLSEKEVDGLCDLASSVGTVVTANYNTPVQTVVSGEAKAVSAVVRFAEKKNGRAVVLPVSGAFHSPLMNEAALEMTEILNEVDFRKPRFPVISNATGETESDPGRLKQLLGQQMTAPVLWTKTSATLGSLALDEMVECWPKLYVGTLVKKCLPQDKKIVIRAAA